MDALLSELDDTRIALGMTYAVLAARSGVSMPTVVRMFSGRGQPLYDNVRAIAESLGRPLQLPKAQPYSMLQEQAAIKATMLINTLQGTSGLEGQALSQESLDELRLKTEHQLLAGSKRRLWAE